MNFGKNPQHDFPKMRGGGVKGRLELFPKIHPFWNGDASLSFDAFSFIVFWMLEIRLYIFVFRILFALPKKIYFALPRAR